MFLLQSSIDELSADQLPVTDITNFANDLDTLIQKIKGLGLQVNEVLQSSLVLIRDNLVTMTAVGVKALRLRDAFVAVQTRRNLTKSIDGLVASVEVIKQVIIKSAFI